MSDPTAGSVSWEVGPADSRTIRTLLYLAEGLLGGATLLLAVDLGRSALPEGFAGNGWLLALVAVFGALLLRWVYILILVGQSDRPRQRWMDDWPAVRRWRWSVGLALLVGAALVAVELRSSQGASTQPSRGWFGAMFVAFVCAAAAQLLRSSGEIDADSLTLATTRYGERREVDLQTLTRVRTLSLGGTTLLWLSVTPGVENRTAVQGLYAIPTPELDRARPAFEAGLAVDPPLDADAIERGRFFRRVNRFVAAGFFLLAVGVLAAMVWLGGLFPEVVLFVWVVAGLGVFLLKLAA